MMQSSDIMLLVLAVFCPPLSAVFKGGLSYTFLLNILLTLLGYLPGLVHAWYLVFKFPKDQYHVLPIRTSASHEFRDPNSIDLEVGVPTASTARTSSSLPPSPELPSAESSAATPAKKSKKKSPHRKSLSKSSRRKSSSASTSKWNRWTSFLDFPDPTQQPPPESYYEAREAAAASRAAAAATAAATTAIVKSSPASPKHKKSNSGRNKSNTSGRQSRSHSNADDSSLNNIPLLASNNDSDTNNSFDANNVSHS